MISLDLLSVAQQLKFHQGSGKAGVSDDEIYAEMTGLLESPETPVRMIACQVLLELSQNKECCSAMLSHGCLAPLIRCVDDIQCGRFSAHIILNVSETEAAAETIMQPMSLALLLRGLRDCDVDWKEMICVSIAQSSRWKTMSSLSHESLELLLTALYSNYIDPAIGSTSSRMSELEALGGDNSRPLVLLGASAPKVAQAVKGGTPSPRDSGRLRYLMYALGHCIGKEVGPSFLSSEKKIARLLMVTEGSLLVETASLVEVAAASMIIHNFLIAATGELSVNAIGTCVGIIKVMLDVLARTSMDRKTCEMITNNCKMLIARATRVEASAWIPEIRVYLTDVEGMWANSEVPSEPPPAVDAHSGPEGGGAARHLPGPDEECLDTPADTGRSNVDMLDADNLYAADSK